jgi:hypothetical protein
MGGVDDHRDSCLLKADRSPIDETKEASRLTTKDTNPKDAIGSKKVPLGCVPAPVLMEIGLGMLEGSVKYGRHNYRVVGVRSSVYYDATMRHLMSWWEGEDIDPVSGINHIGKAMASLVVLRDAIMRGKLKDDRPPKTPPGWVEKMNDAAAEIIDKYPNPVAPYTEVDWD